MELLLKRFLQNDRIMTTLPRAKEIQRQCEHLITLAKRQTIQAHRKMAVLLKQDTEAMSLLYQKIVSYNENRQGNYTRVMKMGHRRHDSALMAVVELTQAPKSLHTSLNSYIEETKQTTVTSISSHATLSDAAIQPLVTVMPRNVTRMREIVEKNQLQRVRPMTELVQERYGGVVYEEKERLRRRHHLG